MASSKSNKRSDIVAAPGRSKGSSGRLATSGDKHPSKESRQISKSSNARSVDGEGAASSSAVTKRRKKKNYDGHVIYIARLLKINAPDFRISKKCMDILNSFACDMVHRIAEEASRLGAFRGSRQTLGSREMQTAVKLCIPGDLKMNALSEGARAIRNLAQLMSANNGSQKEPSSERL